MVYGELYREYGPAIDRSNGGKWFFINDKKHK